MDIQETMQPGKCTQCGASNSINALACSFCGAAIQPDWNKLLEEIAGPQRVTCGKCQSVNHAFLPACLWCGEPLPDEDPLITEKRKALFSRLIQETFNAVKHGYLQGAQGYIGQACLFNPSHRAAQEFRTALDMINSLSDEQLKQQAIQTLRKKISEFLERPEKQ